jgi:hypothetical protein
MQTISSCYTRYLLSISNLQIVMFSSFLFISEQHDIKLKKLLLSYVISSPGSMGPKIQAAIDFVQISALNGRKNVWAAIGDLRDAAKIISNEEGTIIRIDESLHSAGTGVIWRKRDTSTDTKESILPPKQSRGPHKSG